jgi:hypothetical protein
MQVKNKVYQKVYQIEKEEMNEEQTEAFFITVRMHSRTYWYLVISQRLGSNEEQFSIIADQRTITIKSTFRVIRQAGEEVKQRVFSYDEDNITNKKLMMKIIDAIKDHIGD